MLQTCVKTQGSRHGHPDKTKEIKKVLKDVSTVKRLILKSLLKPARAAVSRRENTKATSIKFLDKVRKGYRHLATMLVNEGLLDDEDQVYFLTHDELGELVKGRSPEWKLKATRRRKLLPEANLLSFNDLCYGIPEPNDEEQPIAVSEGQLRGIPVSSGITEARVRIVNTLESAGQLEAGEIMVASFTDIGWTPYFSIISGLITEIGSPLSHGAVVAREYGIPAIVGAKGARQFLKNGDLIRLDGNGGIIERITG